jgi:hypothetical protein
MNKKNFKKYRKSAAVTKFKEFQGRSHWIIAKSNYQEVAEYIKQWLSRIGNVS